MTVSIILKIIQVELFPYKTKVETWHEGMAIDAWFIDTAKVDGSSLGKKFVFQTRVTLRCRMSAS